MSRHAQIHRACSRLLRASSTSIATQTPLLSIRHAIPSQQPLVCLSCQKRTYAAVRAPKLGPSHAEIYNLNGITAQAFEQVVERNGESFKSVSPAQYYDGLLKFTEAIKKGSSPWSVRLPGSKNFSTHGTMSSGTNERPQTTAFQLRFCTR